MGASIPTDDELLDALPHMREVLDLVSSVMILRSKRIREGFREILTNEYFPRLGNALVDATVINLRILDEFFDAPRGTGSPPITTDFGPGVRSSQDRSRSRSTTTWGT
jgi:hypothetical protein